MKPIGHKSIPQGKHDPFMLGMNVVNDLILRGALTFEKGKRLPKVVCVRCGETGESTSYADWDGVCPGGLQ